MKITVQRRLASQVLKCSPKRVKFAQDSLATVKESITKADVRTLVSSGVIQEKPETGNSRGRARKVAKQKAKGLQKGHGSRKGRANARQSNKETWMNRIRLQRRFVKALRDKEMISTKDYRMLYSRIKGGFFRNKRHLDLFMDEKKLISKE